MLPLAQAMFRYAADRNLSAVENMKSLSVKVNVSTVDGTVHSRSYCTRDRTEPKVLPYGNALAGPVCTRCVKRQHFHFGGGQYRILATRWQQMWLNIPRRRQASHLAVANPKDP